MEYLFSEYSDIIVNRKGLVKDSHMQTTKVIGNIKPNKTYTINPDNLKSCKKELTKNIKNIVKEPLYTKIKNNWDCVPKHVDEGSNILGNNGEFQINGNLTIPIVTATIEHLAFYNCMLIEQYDNIQFDTPKEIPVTVMQIGSNYAKDYLLTEMGGGCYLEYHDVPHFHMPLNDQSIGYLILGKIIDENCCLTAFKIPYGYAIYTSPYTIHCDAFLVGDYIVAYTVTDNYSTVLLKNNGAIVGVEFY